ncbi:MAG: glycosyltransferase family 39 protein [Lentisphaeria bacterium]|nr:glycosyltransferase family 39 protein [Lentisphaeria bacterium]
MEERPTSRTLQVLLVIGPLLYLINLGTRQLRSGEALLATIASEFSAHGDLLRTTVHGEQIPAFPLYPWLISLFMRVFHQVEWATRMPSVLAVLGMALVTGWFAYSIRGRLAGVVASSMVLSTLGILRVGCSAQPETVLAFLLTCGWFLWYHFGQVRKQWYRAWAVALFLVLLATFTSGARALVYFYVPFIFMKRPVRGRRRLLAPAHFVSLGVLIIVLFLWLNQVPGQPFMPWNAVSIMGMPSCDTSYLTRLVLFPFGCLLALFPWSLFCWTPFCQAFFPVEGVPGLFRYLRAICMSLAIGVWLIPNSSPSALIVVVPPLAVMTGLHYSILMRRHGRMFSLIPRFLTRIAFWWGAAALGLAALHASGVVVFQDMPSSILGWNSLVVLCICTVAFFCLQRAFEPRLFWLRFLTAVFLLRVLMAATTNPFDAWAESENRLGGEVLSGKVDFRFVPFTAYRPPPPDLAMADDTLVSSPVPVEIFRKRPETPGLPEDVLYRLTEGYHLRECLYIGRRVQRIHDPESDLPVDKEVVYVLGGDKPPILTSRSWTTASAAVDAAQRNRVLTLWLPGGARLVEFVRIAKSVDSGYQPTVLRIYRGELR